MMEKSEKKKRGKAEEKEEADVMYRKNDKNVKVAWRANPGL